MASIEKRGEYWRARVRITGHPEKTQRFTSKAAASRWAKQIETELNESEYVDTSDYDHITLADILERYLKDITPSKRGSEAETFRIRKILKESFVKTRILEVDGGHFAAYRDMRLRQVSSGSVLKELNILSHALEIARKEWRIPLRENPVTLVRKPVSPPGRDRRLQPGEEEKLFAAVENSKNPFLMPVILLAIETAMRQSEIVNLEWKRVYFEKRSVYLDKTKNGHARGIPLSTRALSVLSKLKEQIGDSEHVFPGLTPEAIKRCFARATKRARLVDFHFHDLRHEATSRLFEKGLTTMEVASITGHRTLSMLNRYTHLRIEDLVNKLG